MPALDALLGGKNTAFHIADQNKLNPVKTLCGQPLDKETTRYWSAPENFERADCKVCRGIYFDETWTGEQRVLTGPISESNGQENQQEPDPPVEAVRLFGNLQPPINEHPQG